MDYRLAGKRFRAGVHAAIAVLVVFGLGAVGLIAGLERAFPPAWIEGATFSWGLGSDLVGLALGCVFVVAIIAAPIYGAWALRLKPVIILSAVLAAIGGASEFAVARDHGVGVWPDRITIRDDGVARTYRPTDVAQVETWCAYQSFGRRRRRDSYPTVNYALNFRDGRRISLADTRPRNRAEGLVWLRTIDSLDRVWGAGAARIEPLDDQGFPATRPACAQALKTELAARDFRLARRLLGWSDDHMRRLGLGPREPW